MTTGMAMNSSVGGAMPNVERETGNGLAGSSLLSATPTDSRAEPEVRVGGTDCEQPSFPT